MKTYKYETLALRYLLPYLRTNKDLVSIMRTFGKRYDTLQTAIQELLNSFEINYCRGNLLDYAGQEVGAEREEIDFGNYFCINNLHINTDKVFYFLASGNNPNSILTLADAEFIQKIYIYIFSNYSFGTLEEILIAVKQIFNADNVEFQINDNATIKLKIIGHNLLLTQSSIQHVKNIIGEGIYYLEEIETYEQTDET